jgi:hypothetical protein
MTRRRHGLILDATGQAGEVQRMRRGAVGGRNDLHHSGIPPLPPRQAPQETAMNRPAQGERNGDETLNGERPPFAVHQGHGARSNRGTD